MNMEKGNFTNFQNSYKINENSYSNNFFVVMIRRKKEIYISEKTFWGLVALQVPRYLALLW